MDTHDKALRRIQIALRITAGIAALVLLVMWWQTRGACEDDVMFTIAHTNADCTVAYRANEGTPR